MNGKIYHGNYTNPCLTMHQPWASLLIYGIKRIEGRSWPAPIRGRLWIHAAGKVPDESTVKAMQDFYREIYAVNGISNLKFPEHYPVSRLLGCVEVVGCVRREELACWDVVPEGVRLEGQTDFCWLCEQPQKLLAPFGMRGNQGVYNLEMKIYEAAIKDLTPLQSPLPVKFPLPNPQDPFSLRPGSISVYFSQSKANEVKSSTLSAAIAGAQQAATQFSKKDQNFQMNSKVQNFQRNIKDQNFQRNAKHQNFQRNTIQNGSTLNSSKRTHQPMRKYVEEGETLFSNSNDAPPLRTRETNKKEQSGPSNCTESSRQSHHPTDFRQNLAAPSKIFSSAVRGLKSQ